MKIFAYAFLAVVLFTTCKKSSTNPINAENLGDPTIKYYSSYSGNVGDTLWISGKNFSKTAQNNIVKFNTVTAVAFQSIVHANFITDSIRVVVPPGAASAILQINVYTKTAVAVDTFYVTTGTWIRRADFAGAPRFSGAAFSIGSRGYVGMGTTANAYLNDLWEYDPTLNTWTRKADYPNGTLRECTSFVNNNKACVGLGTSPSNNFSRNISLNEYDPATNSWASKANFPLSSTVNVVGLSANNKGYAITGDFTNQFYIYDPTLNTWASKNNFPGATRTYASGFVINNELYVGGGVSGFSLTYSDLWKYSPATDKWTQLASAFTNSDYPSVAFTLNGKGYRGLYHTSSFKDSGFYEYDPSTNKWAMKKAFPGIANGYQLAFTVNNRAFVTCGLIPNGYSAETWEFVP